MACPRIPPADRSVVGRPSWRGWSKRGRAQRLSEGEIRLDKENRLEGARQALAGAKMLLENEDFRGCVSRGYYAVYQAMWAVVGDPERKPRWEHFGIIKAFVRGNWFDPQAGMKGPGVFERYRFALRRLYDLRLGADYRLDDITRREAQWALDTTQEIIALAEQKGVRDGTTDKES